MVTTRCSGVLAGAALAALLALPAAGHAQESGHSHGGGDAEAASLEETVTQIEGITEHFTQMRVAVEDNASLAEQWATPPVLGAVENTAILTSKMAELVVALRAQLDGALASEDVRANHGVHDRLADLQSDVDALTEVLAGMGVKFQGFEDDFHAH